ncbi:MAG: VCBS repeat-containing protein [Chloroflexota bacterium]
MKNHLGPILSHVAFNKPVMLVLIGLCLLASDMQTSPAQTFTQSPQLDSFGTNIPPRMLSSSADWSSDEADSTQSVGWGDVDNDGDLDLAIGNFLGPNRLYLNDEGRLSTSAEWHSDESDVTYSVAWGDVDGDGDLDLAVGNGDLDLAVGNSGSPNRLYLNHGGRLSTSAEWRSDESDNTHSISWGDVDGDGDLDLAVGNSGSPNRLYLNHEGRLATSTEWHSDESDDTYSVSWGDVDGDGDLDLAVGNSGSPNRLYLNDGEKLSTSAEWHSNESDGTRSVDWGDVDGDGDLDLAIGNEHAPNRLYLNDGKILSPNAVWHSSKFNLAKSVEWGDVDGDGDLDLAIGNDFGLNRLYLNENGRLANSANWYSDESDSTNSIALGDVDGDGDLDLAVGNSRSPNRLYLNQGKILSSSANWHSEEADPTRSVAWGDIDGDGDLDLAVGNSSNSLNQLYLNEDGVLTTSASWQSNEPGETRSVAWGDVDNDGDLDLAVGNSSNTTNRLYLNDGGSLSTSANWHSDDSDSTSSVAWGDVDGDGDLDLAVGNEHAPNRLYLNHGGMLSTGADWHSEESDSTNSIAWGDVDGDGDLDLAVGNSSQGPNQLYLNDGGTLSPRAEWRSEETDETRSVAWGDVDGDGDLDLAVGNSSYSPNRLYLNNGGMLSTSADWHSDESDSTRSIAWGDADGDGDLDLAVGNTDSPNRLYLNDGGMLSTSAEWHSEQSDATRSVAWGDVDGDGDLDLAAANWGSPNRLYLNRGATQLWFQPTASVQIGQLQSQENRSLQASFYGNPKIHSSNLISLPMTVTVPTEHLPRAITITYSLDGNRWHPAYGTMVSTKNVQRSQTEPSDELKIKAVERIYIPIFNAHNQLNGVTTINNTYLWDVYASEFFGQSDNVIARIEVHLGCTNSCQRASISTQSFPSRVRGTQVRVLQEAAGNMQPAVNAIVYHRKSHQNPLSHSVTDVRGHIMLTDSQGYLQGKGEIAVGDHLLALWPVTTNDSYSVYFSSVSPALDGPDLAMHTVDHLGLQKLVVSSDNPLILFHLDVSLEWGLRYDRAYLDRLKDDLERASETLYDWSNGQAALGEIAIYQSKGQWDSADIRIHATNRLRPHATIGGIVPNLTLDTISLTNAGGTSESVTHLYAPGHVEMGAVWNRYGEPEKDLSEDWARTLAHELGHYLFFLHDNYLGLDADNQIIRVEDCPGVMSNPYYEINSEFHPETEWLTNCQSTLSQAFVGRHDWATIVAHYPWLHEPDGPIDDPTQAGPRILPLAVTHVRIIEPTAESNQIDVPTFELIHSDLRRYLPSTQARAFLFQDGEVVDLGTPQGESLLARSARPDDMVCVYDLGHRQNDGAAAPVTGCQAVQTSGELIPLSTPNGGWQPDVIITPQSAQTLTISVQHTTSVDLPLTAQLYVDNQSTQDGASKAITTALAFDTEAQSYTGVLHLNQPVYEAYLHIFVEGNPAQGVVVDYSLDGAPVLILSEGDVLTLSDGSVLILASGEQRPLADGDTLTFHRGQVQIRQPDGSIRVLADGERLILSGGAIVIRDGEAIPISDGTALAMGEGTISIERPDGRFELQPGDALAMGEGTGFVFGDEQGGVVIWQLSGGALAMGEGTALAMGEGTALAMGEGTALAMGEGTVLWITNGRASIIGDSQVSVVGGGNAIYLGDGHAPIRSSDGQVSLYGKALNFEQGQFYTLQPATLIPNEPLWATSVGQGYRVTASPGAPDFNGISISMNYIGRTVDDDKEPLLTIYYWDTDPAIPREQKRWHPLQTKVDDDHNFATAKAVGPGIYMLMYSFDIPLTGKGWDLFSYPIFGRRSITQALSSIDPYYSIIYHHNRFETELDKQWTVYGQPPVPAWVNSLKHLEFQQIYWISATHTTSITLRLGDTSEEQVRATAANSSAFTPPATYYGYIQPSADFSPTADKPIEAWIDDTLCGKGKTLSVDSQVGFVVIVHAAGAGQTAGCGTLGRSVRFEVEGQALYPEVGWDNNRITEVSLSEAEQERSTITNHRRGQQEQRSRVYLPLFTEP